MTARLFKFVRSSMDRTRSAPVGPLTPLELEFLPPALEIEATPPSPAGRGVLWSIIALSAISIGWACIGEIDVVATAPGKVVPDGKIKVLQSMDGAIVRALHVKEGQHVRQGDLLVELDSTVSNADFVSSAQKSTLAQLELARLNAELDGGKANYELPGARADMVILQDALLAARNANYSARLAEAANNLQSKELELAAAEDAQRKLDGATKSSREREERMRPHVGTVISRFDYMKLKDELSQNENDLAAQIHHVREVRERKAGAEQHIRQIQQERRSQIIGEINDKNALLMSLRSDTDKAAQSVSQKALRSPVDGVVQSLNVTTVGAVVSPAQTIATIVPADTPLVVEAVISNDDIGFVKVGQAVDIKVDTFSFQKYGAISGRIVWISPDAEERQAAKPNAQTAADTSVPSKAGLMYKVRIKPDRSALNVNGQSQPISSGMTVQADINTDRRKIIEFLLSPIAKAWSEGMKVR